TCRSCSLSLRSRRSHRRDPQAQRAASAGRAGCPEAARVERPITKRTQFAPLFATNLKRQANSASRPLRLRTPPPHCGMADAAALTPASLSDRTAAGPCRPAMCAPVCTPTEIFHFLFFCYCLGAKKGYSMDDCAPTTGGVHNVRQLQALCQ